MSSMRRVVCVVLVEEAPEDHDPGVVDEDVELAEPLAPPRRGTRRTRRAGSRPGPGRAAPSPSFGGLRPCQGAVEVADRDAHPGPVQGARGGEPEPAGAAGDRGDPYPQAPVSDGMSGPVAPARDPGVAAAASSGSGSGTTTGSSTDAAVAVGSELSDAPSPVASAGGGSSAGVVSAGRRLLRGVSLGGRRLGGGRLRRRRLGGRRLGGRGGGRRLAGAGPPQAAARGGSSPPARSSAANRPGHDRSRRRGR